MTADDRMERQAQCGGLEDASFFPSENSSGWHLNATDEPLILREPSLEECADHLAAFRRFQLPWVVDVLCEPNRSGSHVFGLAGSVSVPVSQPSKESPVHWVPRVMSIQDVPPGLWNLVKGETSEAEARNMLLGRASLADQQAFVRALMPADAKGMAARLKSKDEDRLIHLGLENALENAENGTEFIHALLKLAREVDEASTARMDGERMPGNRENKSFVPHLFALHLCGRGILLLPLGMARVPGKTDGPGFPLAGKMVGARMGLAVEKTIKSAHSSSKAKGQRMERLLHALAGVTTLSKERVATPEGFAATRDLLRDKGLEKVHDAHVLIAEVYDALRPAGSGPLPKTKRKSAKESLCVQCGAAVPAEHAWTTTGAEESVLEPGSPAKFSSPLLVGRGETVQHFAHVLDETLKDRKHVRIGCLLSDLKKFLEWVAWRHSKGLVVETRTHCVPVRTEIRDEEDDATSPSFRSWLYRTHGPDIANYTLSSLSEFFALHLAKNLRTTDSAAVARHNPIQTNFDFFPRETPEPSKTVRTPIPRSLLALLLEENRRDDYAVSRGNREHLRTALDPATGEHRKIWFPGPSLLLELLILLPIRSFQARFLDSGEFDETRHGIVAGKLASGKNPKGMKKRSEGVIRTFTDMDGEQAPGLHINTNKSGTEANGHQFIPWASEDILRLIERMSAWQEAHNPNGSLVPCSEKVEVQKLRRRGSATVKRLKMTIPLFRDPADSDGWPLTRGALNQHWIKVNEAVERRLAEAGKKVVLVEKKEGPNGRTVKTATSDIHTLRVSGISGMVNAGISPELVKEIAGHSTLVMTLYYVKTSAEAMRQKLDAGWADFFKASDDPALGEADFMELSKSLFNSDDSELPKEMLARERRLGRGTLNVFTHGVCPGGECESGGEDGSPLPRAEACPLCRYRLTGPAFLPGLVMNANVLIHELRCLGLEIGALNAEARALDDAGKMSAPLKAKVESLYRKSDAVAKEWAAETQYAKAAQDWLERSGPGDAAPVVFGAPAPECRLERVSHFELLQRLAEDGQTFPGACPSVVLTEHREYLNEVLMASDMDPLLLKLKGGLRDKAAALLGKAMAGMVPVEVLDEIRAGKTSLADFPNFKSFFETLKAGAAAGALDWTKPGPKVLQDKGDAE